MLALVGSGEYLPAMELVDQELIRRLPESPRVVCLPTAAGTEGHERINYWSRLGVDHFTQLGAQVDSLPVIDRASANDSALAQRIAEAELCLFIWGKARLSLQNPCWQPGLASNPIRPGKWRLVGRVQRWRDDPRREIFRFSRLENWLQFSARRNHYAPFR